MPRSFDQVAILLADITGSTPLYERAGDAAAARQVGDYLHRLKSIAEREGGTFIRSRGDDILCTFAVAASALKAARLMLAQISFGPLAIHAGVHFGRTIHAQGDVFGDAVNLTARLAASAKPGEILASRDFLDRLPQSDAGCFRVLDSMTFKGRNAPTEVYSFLQGVEAASTEMLLDNETRNRRASQAVTVTLRYKADTRMCKDRDNIVIGRSPECNLVIVQPWISRRHASLAVRGGKAQLDDQSSSGTYVTMREGEELFLRRESALLTGSGIISPARRPTDSGAEIIHFQVKQA